MGYSNTYATITIAGNVGRDPETRSVNTKNGAKSVVSFSVATDHGWGDRKSTTFWNVEVWGKDGEFAAENLRKGSPVTVTGAVYERKYEFGGIEKRALQIEATSLAYERKKGEGGQTSAQAAKAAPQSASSDDSWD